MNIDELKPTKAVIKKLTDYFNKGSMVNVKAIKDHTKLLTYYYAACQMGWYELQEVIDQNHPYAHYGDKLIFEVLDEIRDNVKVDESIRVSRGTKAERRLFDCGYKKIWLALKTAGVAYNFRGVSPTVDECWKDRTNGCAYTLAWDLETEGGKKVHWTDISNEGGGSFGYQLNPHGQVLKKTDLEDRVLALLCL